MENKTEKIESLKEIYDISELNSNLSQFQALNEFIKQGLMFIALKKGKKENVSEEDIDLFKIKEFSDTEQQDIDTFLLQTVAQLSHFNVSVTQAETLLMEWVKERNTLDKAVFSQIRELQVQAINADEVDDLKENVSGFSSHLIVLIDKNCFSFQRPGLEILIPCRSRFPKMRFD